MSRNRKTASAMESPSQPLLDTTAEAVQSATDIAANGRNTAPSNSIKKSARSILAIHNETVNIWSHILGCILFLTIPVYVFTTEIPPRYKVATRQDIAVCTTYFIGVATCFFLSATVQLDYLGILILMYSAMIPLIYYGFVCDHFLRNAYWGLVSVLAGLCALSTMHPRFRTVKAKAVRGALYSAFGASSFAPIIHAVNKYGWEVQKDRMGLIWYAYVALFNAIGVVAYALKVPERFFPGRFDIQVFWVKSNITEGATR
ncbi:hypothetical protein FSARC_138 [Fusarium sarcochroum]|uniref:Uncharacterized protein n=1 Tax=Fusarium sarcochroum TaxID=1208366 RepID=A0A8H4UCI9_9HYPO|nr:hypothetical protein FSARC_138 [Fusarium sarcochroum]